MLQRLIAHPRFYYILFVVFLVPALLINLDSHHIFIHTDEGRRALVALEMMLQDQYLAPTLNGDFYYEKPPLWNWILTLSFRFFGDYSLFALRFPVFLCVIAFAGSIVYFLKPVMGSNKAWFVMMVSITSGRILLYDSFLGLMDIALGLLVFTNFMLFYHLGKQKRYLLLFVLTYSITAIGYLMKGLPSLVFQAFTIFAYAAHTRSWRFIFHKFNFLGTLFLFVPLLVYYFFYLQVNPDSLLTVFEYTVHQSSQRTVTDYGIWPTILAILAFPFENLYHFAPWTILLFALFSKKVRWMIWQNDFMRFAIIVVAFNIWVYWTAPGTHPRYLFMFVPIIFAIAVEAYLTIEAPKRRIIDYTLLTVMLLMVFVPVLLPFIVDDFPPVRGAMFKLAFLTSSMAVFAWLFYGRPAMRIASLALFMLVLRIGIDWFVLPFRNERGRLRVEGAMTAARIVGDEKLYILPPNYCHNGSSFIISSIRKQVLEQSLEAEPGNFYLIDHVSFEGGKYDNGLFEVLHKFGTEGSDRELYLVKLKE